MLPQFPAVTLPALGACWDRCTQGLQRTLNITWGQPNQVFCGEYVASLLVNDAITGMPMTTGKMVRA